MNKYAVVFGGAMNDTSTKEYLESVELVKILTNKGFIIKSGGYRGIMEAVSKGAYESGGKSIGYTCKTFPSTRGNKYLTGTVICDDIYDRLRGLIENTDLYIVQRGGIGTLSELFLSLDVIRKMENKPPIILIGSFWRDIFDSFEVLFQKELALLKIIDDYKDIENFI